MNHALYLIPNAISDDNPQLGVPLYAVELIANVRTFFVEEPKSARRLLKQLNPQFPLQECRYLVLNTHTKMEEIHQYIALLKQGSAGIISEAGCPCVADPGSNLVLLAHQHNIDVIALTGASSILLALMSSGLSGQNFAFNGYLPKGHQERMLKIKALERRSLQEQQTQIFMETPYRNQNMLEDVLNACDEKTFLAISCDIYGTQQFIKTRSIKDWKKQPPQLPKKPALFIINKIS